MYRSWLPFLGVILVVLSIFQTCEAKSKVKTTFKKLKCPACFAVVNVMRKEVEHEWESRAGDTILVEKRKKKTKVSYVDSELSVQEAVDRVCEEDRYSRFNVTAVHGVPQYTSTPNIIDNKEYRKHLSGTCQTLIADFEHDIVHFFHSKKGTSEFQAAERAICTDITKMCTLKETDKLQSNLADTNSENPTGENSDSKDKQDNGAENTVS